MLHDPAAARRLARRDVRRGVAWSGATLHDWRRNFLAVWPSLFVVSMGLMAFIPMLPLYLEERFGITDPHELRVWSGLVFAAGPFSAAFFGPLWGAFADRHGRKPMALRAILGIAVVTFLMPSADSVALLMWLRLAQGVLAGYVAPAMALVSADVPVGRHGRTIGNLQVGLALGLLVGPAVGAEIAAGYGREAVFYFTSAGALAASLPVWLFAREPERARTAPDTGMFTVARRLLASRLLLCLFGCLLAMRFGQNMVEAYVALWVDELGPLPVIATGAQDRAHAIDRTTAVAFGILAVAQVLLTSTWGRLADRFGPLRCLAVLSLGLGVTLAATGLARSIEGFLVARAITAVFLAGGMTLAYASVSKRVPQHGRSFAFACVQSCIQLGISLGPACGGFLSRATGLGGLFHVAGAIVFATGIAMALLARRPFPDWEDDA